MADDEIILETVTEYMEGHPVLIRTDDQGRRVLHASNQGGYDAVEINLGQLIAALDKLGLLPSKEKLDNG